MIGGHIGKPIGGAQGVREGITGIAAITLDNATLSATGALALKAALTKTLDDATLSATGALALKGSAAITLADATLAATGVLPLQAAAAITLDGISISAAGALALKANVNVTLDDVVLAAAALTQPAITDTEILQLPIDCVLAGQQPYKESGREYEIRSQNIRSRPHTMRSGVRALKGGRPSFTVTTNNRGYD